MAASRSNTVPVIHVVVALCDNEHQGIIPVPARIGNGDDLVDNLYWGADYGVKTYFRHLRDWNLVASVKNPSPIILERVIFEQPKSGVLMIADAYRGREIRRATEDFVGFASGESPSTIQVHGKVFTIGGGADMNVYVGHNGLMDFRLSKHVVHSNLPTKKVAILCCKSQKFFAPMIRPSGAKPLLWTKDLMAPEAYILEAAIQSFTKHDSDQRASERASIAYAKYQHCSLRAAKTIFTSGF